MSEIICEKCGNKNNYNFALNIGLCEPCIGEQLERHETALERIQTWAKAYPLEVFPKPTKDNFKQAAEVLKANGLSLDRISADNMRHVLDGIKDIVEEALSKDKDNE